MTRVAIMQPTYLPWCGYFGLMHAVDVFVLLDSVQFARRSWQQRNQIKGVNGAQWLSVPVAAPFLPIVGRRESRARPRLAVRQACSAAVRMTVRWRRIALRPRQRPGQRMSRR